MSNLFFFKIQKNRPRASLSSSLAIIIIAPFLTMILGSKSDTLTP